MKMHQAITGYLKQQYANKAKEKVEQEWNNYRDKNNNDKIDNDYKQKLSFATSFKSKKIGRLSSKSNSLTAI